MKKIFATSMFAIGITISINAQTNKFPSTGAAGIGTTSPNTSSLLEIKSTTKGFLMSRMTLAQRNAITTPATGLLIYQTNNVPGFYYYNGSAWKPVAKNFWSLTGNAGTNPSTNFIGTTDAQSLVFKVNGLRAGLIDYSTCCSGTRNTSFGQIALNSVGSGADNTAMGYGALYTNTIGNQNVAYGKYALFNNNAGNNTALGFNSMFFNTTGTNNIAIGNVALQNNSNGSLNTAIGAGAGASNSSGSNNVFIGANSGQFTTDGSRNVYIGYLAHGTDLISNSVAIGANAEVTASNSIILGASDQHVGIGTTDPGPYQLKISYSNANDHGLGIENNSNPNKPLWEIYTAPGTSDPDVSGWLEFFFDGDYTAAISSADGQYYAISDARLKTGIKPMQPVLNKIRQLKPSTYQFKNTASKEEHDGFIAQDVMKLFPDIVKHNINKSRNLDVYAMNYSGFGVLAIKAIQELDSTITTQKKLSEGRQAAIKALEDKINKLEVAISSIKPCGNESSSIEVNIASLQQNIPNPFTNNATIGYTLPQKFTSAQIVITDKNGKTIKAVDIAGSGKGSLKVDASTLASGAYQYSLIVDGKRVDTKQMVLAK